MNEDTLARALGSLKAARMDDFASDRVREEIEKAWRQRATRHARAPFAVPSFVRAFAVAALVVAVAFTTMSASADSPLYGARVAIEDGLVAFRSDPVDYLTQLYQQRLEEAARFEAIGNALAASKARAAQEQARLMLNKLSPQPNEPEPSASPSTAITVVASPTPTPEPSAEPTESPTATPRPPVATVRTPSPTDRPAPTPTPKPPTPKPVVTPTPSPMTIHATGDVLYADGSPVDGACVSMTGYGTNCMAGTTNGRVSVTLTARKGQTITLYFQNYDAARGGTLKGRVTATVGGESVLLGTITLR